MALFRNQRFEDTYDSMALHFEKESNIQVASKTPVFGDAMWVDCGPMETDFPATNLLPANRSRRAICSRLGDTPLPGMPTGAKQGAARIQSQPADAGSINLSCADGHVELSPLEKLWNYYWHLNWKTPNPGRAFNAAVPIRSVAGGGSPMTTHIAAKSCNPSSGRSRPRNPARPFPPANRRCWII